MFVLKNSEKYTVFKFLDNKKRELIQKISNRKYSFIKRELNHISKLKKSSNFYKKKFPKILKYGILKKGVFKGKGYYNQIYINGETFSKLIKEKKISNKKINTIFNFILKTTANELKNNKNIIKRNSFILYKKLFNIEYNKIKKKNLFNEILKYKKIIINNAQFNNLDYYLKFILSSKKIIKFLKKNHIFSSLSHWNFHGENIIIINKKKIDFMVIDPDSSWKYNDSMFSLARLIYTYPHDTAEYDKYFITQIKNKNLKNKLKFNLNFNWDKFSQSRYENIFDKYFFNINRSNFNNILTPKEHIRFCMSLALCLLRGINANYEAKFHYLKKNSNKFLNKSFFLFLFCLVYLKNFIDKFNNEQF